ncbi:signal transduction histidine kinase regulating citrate/malate metabolism [Thermosinus carboxydivorans Nor1]|uniref:Signal transduction histidine kinase regulating citrate/malate metabolism n=1 Tax=Thermosinus carboxydivorans Nor1 TaxID=401526 RepID=A1HNY8_9FIRM|nr:Spo0B domain-containing protein [Thermosinus carboxydivorans]EAX48096.1 signal transduction histidine kinase regulating citrate/malate metabolism [Thermosinus carboxydivorans Nor1]
MATGEVCSELIRLLKMQRHDFINHLQVIHAMLQLGRVEKALKYIEDLSHDQALVTEQLANHKELANCQRKTGT